MNVAVVCFGFERSNRRNQPWRYVSELATGLPASGVDTTVITDVEADEPAGLRVVTVPELLGVTGPSRALVRTIDRVDPDVVVTLVGPTSFLRRSTVASTVDRPTIGLFSGPIYSPADVLRVGPAELLRHRRYLAVHLLGSLVTDRRFRTHAAAFDRLVTLTDTTRRRLHRAGVETALSTIPPGIDESDLAMPTEGAVRAIRDDLTPDGVPLILYFTSPLTLRGTDTLVEAFARLRDAHACRLVVLSRQDDGGLAREEARLRRLARKRSVADGFALVPRSLSPAGVRAHLAAADVVALPFKLVQAAVPISLLEAMAMGNPVVSTTVAGVPELVDDGRQLASPGDVSSLTTTLERFVADEALRAAVGSRNRDRMRRHHRWDDARARFVATLEAVA